MNEETTRLILDLANNSKNTEELIGKLQTLNVTAKATAENFDNVANAAEEAATATTALGTAATGATGIKAAGGRGLLGASYAIQDFTSVISQGGANALPRAMGAISNNMDQIALAAGATIKQAAGLSIAFTGLTAAMPAVISLASELWKALGGGGKGPEPVLDAIDAAGDRLKQIKSDLEAIMKSRPFQERETQGLVKEYFAEVGGPQFVKQLADAIAAAGKGAQPTRAEGRDVKALQDWIAAGEAAGQDMAGSTNRLRDLQRGIRARIAEEDRQKAGALVGEAGGTGPGAEAARRMIGGFMPRVGEELAGLSPEARAKQEEEVAAEEDKAKQLHAAGERRKAAAKAATEAPEHMDAAVKQFQKIQKDKLTEAQNMMGDATDQYQGKVAAEKEAARAKAAEAREKARVERAEFAEAKAAAAPEETQRQKAMGVARRDVSAMSEAQGLGTPSAEQAEEMAREVIASMRNGMNRQQAAWMAVAHKLQDIQQATAEFEQMMTGQAAQAQMMGAQGRRQNPPMMGAGW